jgi:hypothetical protein
MAFTLWTSSDRFAFAADNGCFLTLVPAVIVAVGVPAALWAKYGRRAAYFTRDRGPAMETPAKTTAP